MINDASIIELFWRRDEQAIVELQKSYGNLCFKIANNILNQMEDAEECVSSAYCEIWNTIPPEHPNNLSAYTCKIVKNFAINKLKYNLAEKRSKNFSVSLTELEDCVRSDLKPEEIIETKELSKSINEFLRKQNEISRKIFVRRYWHSDSIDEIARLYDMNKKTVSTVLFRTRKKLKQHLKKEGFIHE